MKNYKRMARNILTRMGVSYSCHFVRHGIHFIGESQTRDIFECTLSRNNKSISFFFGQSLADSDHKGGKPPSEYDLLSCIEKYPFLNYKNFCSGLGYTEHEKNSYRIFKSVNQEALKVQGFFSNSELEILSLQSKKSTSKTIRRTLSSNGSLN